MSDKPIYYFTANGSGDNSGKSFSNAKPFSAIGTPELSANFEGRFYRYVWNNKPTYYVPNHNGITSLSAVTLVGGYSTSVDNENAFIEPGVFIDPVTYTTRIGYADTVKLTKDGKGTEIYKDRANEPSYEQFITDGNSPLNRHKFEFLGNCKISNITFANQCSRESGKDEPVVSVKGDNNEFSLVRFYQLMGDRYTIDFSGATNTKLLSCCIRYATLDSAPIWSSNGYWFADVDRGHKGIISSGMNILTSNLKPYEYCIGNAYNRGINKPLTKEDINDPYNFIDDWYNNDGDIYNFENFGLNLWVTNGVAYASRNHVFLGAYCGIKYRNHPSDKFPISLCKDTYFQDWSEQWSNSTYNVYFRNIGWGEHYETPGQYVGTTAVGVFSGGFTAGPNNKPEYIKYNTGYDKSIFTYSARVSTLNISSTIQNVNKPLNKYSYLMYDNARPYTDIYKLDENKVSTFQDANPNKFVGKLNIDGKVIHYTYNVYGTSELSGWNYDTQIKPYIDTNPENYKDIDPFYDENNTEKYKYGILYEGMIGFIKNHPECVVGGVECNVDAFNMVQYQVRYFNLDDGSPYNYDKHDNLTLDIAPRALKLRGGLYDSRNYNNRKDGFANAFKVPSSTWWTWNGAIGTPFATIGQLCPKSTSLIQYELNPYYTYIKSNGANSYRYDTNNITVPDKLIYNGTFKVGNVECNNTTSHKYSIVTLGRGQHNNSSNPVYEGAKNAFIFDNNQLISVYNTKTDSPSWPAVITTSTYKKYHVIPIYGNDSNKSPSTTGRTASRYYCRDVEGWFSYNPIEFGWAFIINNPNPNNSTFGAISSLTLIDSTYIPNTFNDMVTMFGCMTSDKEGNLIYNTVHNTVFIKDTVPTTSKSLNLQLFNLDLTKYTILTLKNTSFLTEVYAVINKNGNYINISSSDGGGFVNSIYAHNANVYERIILHPYLQNINVDMYDEESKTFKPVTRIGSWGTDSNTVTKNVLDIINNTKDKYTTTLQIVCETENGKADFETNLVSALSCYNPKLNNVAIKF